MLTMIYPAGDVCGEEVAPDLRFCPTGIRLSKV